MSQLVRFQGTQTSQTAQCIGVICIWSKYNTERQSHLLSRHFSAAPSFHSPFLSISSTIFLFTLPFFLLSLMGIFNFLFSPFLPYFLTLCFLSPCFFPFTYLPMQRIEMLVKVSAFTLYSFFPRSPLFVFLSGFVMICIIQICPVGYLDVFWRME